MVITSLGGSSPSSHIQKTPCGIWGSTSHSLIASSGSQCQILWSRVGVADRLEGVDSYELRGTPLKSQNIIAELYVSSRDTFLQAVNGVIEQPSNEKNS